MPENVPIPGTLNNADFTERKTNLTCPNCGSREVWYSPGYDELVDGTLVGDDHVECRWNRERCQWADESYKHEPFYVE